MAKTKRVADAILSGVKTPAQMKMEMAVGRARNVLPQAEREANKAKFLEQSADPRRFYHGTKNPDITEFKSRKDLTDESNMTGHYADERDAVFLSPEPDFTSSFSVMGYTDEGQAPTTYPVYAQIKNPFDFDNPEHLQRVKDTYKDMYHNPESELYDPYLQSSERSIDLLKFNKAVDNLQGDPNNWGRIENQKFQDVLKDIGYDSFYTRERGTKNLGIYDPNKIKSAIGNQGTYDLSEPDINKARGGAVKMGKGGLGRKLGNLLPKPDGAFRPTQAGDTVGGYMVREDIPNRSSIGASLENYKTLGLQEVPMTAFGVQGKPQYYSTQNREYTQNLAEQINQNKELNPLIVVKDKEGYYVLEGGHRFDALRELNAQSFPALVVEDLDGMARGGIIKMSKGGAGRKLADKLLPKVEAPSIMTRSDISELAEYIKNREGGYGLRRVERAADEIPRLGELYSQDALRSAFSGDNARALMTMNPADFEKYAIPLEDNLRDESVKNIANLIGIRHKGGFDSVPYFEVNKEEQGLHLLPFISGHEGRHRNRALSAAGEEAGLVQFLPRAELREPFERRYQDQYIDAIRKEMAITGNKVFPQKYTEPNPKSLDDTVIRRPAIDLPDLYAEGGAVKPPAIFEEAQVPFEEIRRQLGMRSGGAVHMQDGGDPQAEIDRMRYELSNSPVIQATPQTPIQRAIGTLGGYMDRAGQFVSESIEPLAEKHPIKHFLGELLLADSLKSAGTAMQDYTKTSRDITEDQPYVRAPLTGSGQTLKLDPRMLDVMGIAQPVASATTRLVGAGAKKAAPFAKDVAEMASELYMKGDIPGMVPPNLYAVSPEVKPSKVLAPANEQGFYSATEAAALNLQRKSGSGQALLNDIMKGENVKSDEISAMGLDTFLKDKKDVTAAEVQDFIASNKIQLGESTYRDRPKMTPEQNTRLSELQRTNYDRMYPEEFDAINGAGSYEELMRLQNARDGFNAERLEYEASRMAREARKYQTLGNINGDTLASQYRYKADHLLRRADLAAAEITEPKYKQYQLPGGENYREIVLTLPEPAPRAKTVDEAFELWKQDARAGKRGQYSPEEINSMQADNVLDILKDEYMTPLKKGVYQSSHFDEPNVLSHLRVSDRVTDGKKTLLVDEVQSDWHQAARDARTLEIKRLMNTYNVSKENAQKAVPENFGYKGGTVERAKDYRWDKSAQETLGIKENDPAWVAKDRSGNVVGHYTSEDAAKTRLAESTGGVPDAPYKEDWYQLTLRRAIKEAVDGGYDRVALPTGARVNERFDLSKQIDRIAHKKNADGTYSLAAVDKEGRTALNDKSVPQDKLAGIVGKEVAQKIIDAEGKGYPKGSVSEDMLILSGLDLKVGGAGNKKYYDEIYPNYLKKFGKKYGSQSGMTTVDAGGTPEPLHYMEITPAMREEFKAGIHMKRGGKVSFANNIDAMRLALSKG